MSSISKPDPGRLLACLRRLDLTEVESAPFAPDDFGPEMRLWCGHYIMSVLGLPVAGGPEVDADGVTRYEFRIPWSDVYSERLESIQRLRALIMVLFPYHDASLFRFAPMRWTTGWHPWAPITIKPKNP